MDQDLRGAAPLSGRIKAVPFVQPVTSKGVAKKAAVEFKFNASLQNPI